MVVRIKKPLAVIAAVVLTLLLAVSTAVPAFAEETGITSQSNAQFEIVDPKYEGDTNNYVTLPDAPDKEGYTFKGWSVDGSTELYSAGKSIVNNDGHKLQLQPVYEAKAATPKATSAPVAEQKDTSETQQTSSDVIAQDATSIVDEIDVNSRLRDTAIGLGLFVLSIVLFIVARLQEDSCNDGVATVLAVLALIAGVVGIAFAAYGCVGLFTAGVALGGNEYLIGFVITFILLQFVFHSK